MSRLQCLVALSAAGGLVAIVAGTTRAATADGAPKPRPPVIAWVLSNNQTLTEVNTLTGRVVRTLKLPCPGGSDDVSMTPASPIGYVYGCFKGQHTHIVPVNTRTGAVGAAISIGHFGAFGQGSIHHTQVFLPDGKVLYVGTQGGIRPVAVATGKVGPLIAVTEPAMAVLAPGESVLYVSAPNGTVTPIDTVTDRALPPIDVGGVPDVIALTPNGKTLYVGNEAAREVIPVATATGTVGRPIPVGGYPVDMVAAPSGKTVYVATDDPGTVTPIRTATNRAEPPIKIGQLAPQLAITPDGRTLYLVRLNPRAGAESGAIVPVRTATDRALPAIPMGRGRWSQLLRIEMGPEGSELYALVPRPFRQGELIPISTATNKPGRAIPVPGPIWAGFSQS